MPLVRNTAGNLGATIQSFQIAYKVNGGTPSSVSAVLKTRLYSTSAPAAATITTSSSGFGTTTGTYSIGAVTVTTPTAQTNATPFIAEIIFTVVAGGAACEVWLYGMDVLYASSVPKTTSLYADGHDLTVSTSLAALTKDTFYNNLTIATGGTSGNI